jgi:hypothetical protein
MKQGTVSVLIGCHSIIHSILVYIAWVKLYKKFPSWRETVCIFLHDIGHWGTDYLDNYDEKKRHWVSGACYASQLFGAEGYMLCAGHSTYSGHKKSKLFNADKYSWYLAPRWWLYLNTFTEPKLGCGLSKREAVKRFKEQVAEGIESGKYISTHQLYLNRLKEDKHNEQ